MIRFLFIGLPLIAGITALYFWAMTAWNYSTGERAGWVQKLSNKGWICKTWEGELAMVSMPGALSEKFHFTVWDEAVAKDINAAMGRRVSLHYDEKVGLPTSCFGETRHWVNKVTVVQEIQLAPGITVPVPQVQTPQAPQTQQPTMPVAPPVQSGPAQAQPAPIQPVPVQPPAQPVPAQPVQVQPQTPTAPTK